jgi:hypothetical protein
MASPLADGANQIKHRCQQAVPKPWKTDDSSSDSIEKTGKHDFLSGRLDIDSESRHYVNIT